MTLLTSLQKDFHVLNKNVTDVAAAAAAAVVVGL
jgi:hypothetical protein